MLGSARNQVLYLQCKSSTDSSDVHAIFYATVPGGGSVRSDQSYPILKRSLKSCWPAQGKLNNPKDEDIRAKILRHENPEDQKSSLFSRAYAKTQPTRIYAEPDEQEEKDDKQ